MSGDEQAGAAAARQHGAMSRADAIDAGLSDSGVKRRLEGGRLRKRHAGVYTFAGAPATWQQELCAAVLAAGAGAAVSHRSAGITCGFDGISGRIVEITVPYGHLPVPKGVIVHRSRDLDDRWVRLVDGIPVTTPARTLIDLGAVVGPRTVERAVTSALGRRLTTIAELRATLDALGRKGRRGAGVLRAIVDARSDADPSGISEARLERLLRRAAIPPVVAEHEVFDAGGQFIGRVDFALPAVALAIEVNGYEPHSTFERFTADHVRRNALRAAGWQLVEFTPSQVQWMPDYVIRTVTDAYRSLL